MPRPPLATMKAAVTPHVRVRFLPPSKRRSAIAAYPTPFVARGMATPSYAAAYCGWKGTAALLRHRTGDTG